MLFNLNNPYEAEAFLPYCQKQYDKKGYVEVKRKYPNRTLKQNAYLHVLLGYYASEFGYTKEEVKIDTFKRLCNPDIFIRKRVNNRGKEVSYLRSSADLSTDEMRIAIEKFRFYSENEGFHLPAPHEDELIFFAMQQIEKNAEYI